jgi:oligopeptide/dipeptide ABC transporter ATP-binding protein
MSLLELERVCLKVRFARKECATLLHDVSFSMNEGETTAIVGESGSGKTTLLRAITALTSQRTDATITGRIVFRGEDISTDNFHSLNSLRQGAIRYIFQEPAMAFNPVSRMGAQIQTLINKDPFKDEMFLSHLLELGLSDPKEILRLYPHQLSTGMMQRISIALALLNSPALVLADEPTNAIDVIHRSAVLQLLQKSCKSNGMSLLLATHDLRIAQRYADNVIVLYAGRVIEQSPARLFFKRPLHPYSQLLLGTMPPANVDAAATGQAHSEIRMNDSAQGCSFQSSCPIVQEVCRTEEPKLISQAQDQKVRCPFST